MMIATTEVGLEKIPLLAGLTGECRARLLRSAMTHTVQPGTVLFQQGEVPTFQIVVLAGSVQLFGQLGDEREVLIDVVQAPNLVIPAAIVTNAPYLMQARVPEPARFLLIQADAFRSVVETDLRLAQAVIEGLARQFRRMVRQIKNLKLRSSTQRVGCYILSLSQAQQTPDRATLPYEKNLVASELGITRESFSRTLSSLEKTSIAVQGRVIVILDRDLLIKECGPDPLIDAVDA